MTGRDSDADFGRTLRHGRTIATIIVAVVIATAGVIGAAFAMSRSTAIDAAEKVFSGEEHRERIEHVADAAVEKRVTGPMTRMQTQLEQLKTIAERIDAQTRATPAPSKGRR